MHLRKIILLMLMILILLTSSFALAEGDYEKGDGWVYQDGTLTISDNGGLIDFVSNDKDEQQIAIASWTLMVE